MSKAHRLLCIDAGNTRVKWASVLVDEPALAGARHNAVPRTPAHVVLNEGAIDSTLFKNSGSLNEQLALLLNADLMQSVDRVLFCNVLGEGFRVAMEQACHRLNRPCDTLAVSGSGWMASNYTNPGQLGLDRWAACLAVAGETQAQANLVVSFGTATTLDALVQHNDGWLHRGGFIVPGVSTMLNSLHVGTAQLPLAVPVHQSWPTSTEQAIGAGAVRMQAAMVQSLVGELQAELSSEVQVWFSGGHASDVLPLFANALLINHAVFKGLVLDFAVRSGGNNHEA